MQCCGFPALLVNIRKAPLYAGGLAIQTHCLIPPEQRPKTKWFAGYNALLGELRRNSV